MANIAQMVNVLQSVLLTDGPRMVRTPTYYAFQMYVPFQGATTIPVGVQSPMLTEHLPAIDLSAAKGTDGAIYVALVNIDPDEAADVALAVDGVGHGKVTGTVLSASAMDSRNRFGAPEEVRPKPFDGARWRRQGLSVVMPAKSAVVLKIEGSRQAAQ
jgi:alpha-N-arabinofuranosidase